MNGESSSLKHFIITSNPNPTSATSALNSGLAVTIDKAG